jgi:DNA-binding NarL/FixJ family response regulator
MIRVLVVDDHPIVLAGFSALIESDPGLELVAAARSATDALAVSAEPTVALLDLHLPDGDGINLGATLKRRWPDLRVLVFTMHADDQSVLRSLGSGLDGYLLKDADPDDVLAAIRSAARGALVLGRGAQAAVLAATAAAPQPAALTALDSRDLEILELLVQGLPTTRVAARLFLAPKTIRNRVSDMLAKLGVATREEAIALGRASGLGQGPSPTLHRPPAG